jgi:hypothetical protein
LVDLDGDLHLDLVVTSDSADGALVALGAGDGSFAAPITYPMVVAVGFPPGFDADTLASADLDSDGVLDLVAAGGNVVSVLLGLGGGSFGPPTGYLVGDSASAVAVGLIDGDAVPDLVVVNRFSHDVSLLFGVGDGTFADQVVHAVGSFPRDVAIRDLDGDDDRDLVVLNNKPGDVSVFLNPGDGDFGPAVSHPAVYDPMALAIRDVNDDGVPDLLVSGQGTGSVFGGGVVAVIPGIGDGTFGVPQAFSGGRDPIAMVMGDFDGDARPDVAVANFNGLDLILLLNQVGGQAP